MRVKSPGGPYVRVETEPIVLTDRHWAKVSKDSDGCWRWIGYCDRRGYGKVQFRGRGYVAHRLFYTAIVGPTTLPLDHLCRTRNCVNPDHLEPVGHSVNVQRGRAGERQRQRTHCPQGHPYSGDNLLVYPSGRSCRQCMRDRKAARRRAAEPAAHSVRVPVTVVD